MEQRRVLITTSWLDPGGDVHQLLNDAGHRVVFGRPADLKDRGLSLEDVMADVDGVIAGVEAFDAGVLAAAPRLKVVARTGVGYDNVDVAAASKNGIAVCATPGVNRQSVAEYVIAALLNLARSFPQIAAATQSGEWMQPSGRELQGKTLGIVGLGAIGKTVARLALAFGMDVLAYDPYFDEKFAHEAGVTRATLADLISRSDAVTLHVFLSEDTRHLIDARAIESMKTGAAIINAARGGVIDEEALAAALLSGKLRGAVLDTFEHEPLPKDSPLHRTKNLLLTSHIAGATEEGRARSGTMAARSVIDVLGGSIPQNTVNREAIAAAD